MHQLSPHLRLKFFIISTLSLCTCCLFAEDSVLEVPPVDLADDQTLLDPDIPEMLEELENEKTVEMIDSDAMEAETNASEVVREAIPVENVYEDTTGVLLETSEEMDFAPPEDLLLQSNTWIDSTHNWIYDKSKNTVVWLDTSFLAKGQVPVPTPPPRFRVGLYTQIELKPEGTIKLVPVADFDVDVDLPNLEKRMKLFVSTQDPAALPGEDVFDSDNALRVGASRSWFENWKTSVGIKARWPPEPFAYVQWSPQYAMGEKWSVVPQVKPFWESEDGFGGQTSLLFNRWNHRRMFRQAFSVKWTQELADEDDDNEVDPDSSQFGYNGDGVRWQSTTIWGYVPKLLDERDYGRRIGGADVAKGYAIKGTVSGNAEKTTQATVTLFARRPAYKDFLYFIVGPEVLWEAKNDWNEEYLLKVGFEMLLWGDNVTK